MGFGPLDKRLGALHKLALFGFIVVLQPDSIGGASSHLLAFAQAVLSIWNALPTFAASRNPTQSSD